MSTAASSTIAVRVAAGALGICLLAAGAWFLTPPDPVRPQPALTAPTEPGDKRLVVGLAELDYPPFYFQEDGALRGAALEIAVAVAARAGYELRFERFPWRRMQALLRVGDVDMSILYFKTPERARDVVYTDAPHIHEASSLFVRRDSPLNTASAAFDGDLAALKGHRFGHVRGYSHGPAYDDGTFTKQAVTDERALIEILIRGRIDLAVGNKPAIVRYARERGVEDKLRFLSPPIHSAPNYMAFSRAHPHAEALAALFTRELRQFMQTPEYAQILVRYGFERP